MDRASLLRFMNTTDLKRAISNPSKAVRAFRRAVKGSSTTKVSNSKSYDTKRINAISSLLDVPTSTVEDLLQELRESSLDERLQKCNEYMDNYPFNMGGMTAGGETSYLVARLQQPKGVIEIGVANGVSTAYLLTAADHGEFRADFRAIDKPLFESTVAEQRGRRGLQNVGGIIPDNKEAGWVAPRSQRYNHGYQYYVGDFNKIIEPILSEMEELNLAIYDASKDRTEMILAYEVIINQLEPGGVLISDDIDVNSAFADVTKKYEGEKETFAGCGLFVKSR